MNSFIGKWKGPGNASATIKESKDFLTVDMSNGREPFTGFKVDLTSPVINVNFTDDFPIVGVLSNDKSKIYWSNSTVWDKT